MYCLKNSLTHKIIFLIIFINTWIFAQVEDKQAVKNPTHMVPKVNSHITVDAYLDEQFWQSAVKIGANIEVSPGENITAPVKTDVLLAYNDTHIFVAFLAYDPVPSDIRARYCDRDNMWDDDWVLILFDTFNDHRRTYDYGCNPLGIQTDFIETPTGDGGEWDAIWDSDGRITEEGFIVEMAIPFSSLNFPRSIENQVWGFDAVRSYPRSERHHIGVFPRDRDNNCYMCQSEKLIGFAGASPGKNIELDPTLNIVRSQERKDYTSGPFQNTEKKSEFGLSGHWGITPNMTLSGTLNPDFSNIEADILQLDINNQFAIYYPEKRTFFLESSDFFSTPLNAVHTRTMASPTWGVKLTGKEGAHAVGFFSVQDDITNFLFPGSEGSSSNSVNNNSQATALRYKADVSKSSNLGLLATNRTGDNYENRVIGIDGDIKFTPTDRFRFQAIQSKTNYPDSIINEFDQPDGSFTGNAFDVYYGHDTKNYNLYATHKQISSDFRADLGFISQAGYKYSEIGGQYKWRHDPGHWYNWLSLSASYDYKRDINENLIHRVFSAHAVYEGPMQSHSTLYGEYGSDQFEGIKYNIFWMTGCAGIRPSSILFAHISWTYGDQIDYANTRLGTRFQLNPMAEILLGLHIRLELDHTYEKLNVDPGRLYTANISRLKFIYQFNKQMFLRAILQYKDYNRNTALYKDNFDDDDDNDVDHKTKKLFSQLLFSYKINPQTVFFLGYSDNYYGIRTADLAKTNMTFFLKIGYALTM